MDTLKIAPSTPKGRELRVRRRSSKDIDDVIV
jgi:hypothetical protein